MAAHCPIFAAMQTSAGTHAPFNEWLLNQGVTNAKDFALMGSEDGQILKEIVLVAEAAGVQFGTQILRINVRKLWAACNRLRLTESSTAATTAGAAQQADADI